MKALGLVFTAVLLFMFEASVFWCVLMAKPDLIDGFWRMLVRQGAEFNFAYLLSQLTDPGCNKS